MEEVEESKKMHFEISPTKLALLLLPRRASGSNHHQLAGQRHTTAAIITSTLSCATRTRNPSQSHVEGVELFIGNACSSPPVPCPLR